MRSFYAQAERQAASLLQVLGWRTRPRWVQPPFCYKLLSSGGTQLPVVEASVAAGGTVVGEERAIRGEGGQATHGVDPAGEASKGVED